MSAIQSNPSHEVALKTFRSQDSCGRLTAFEACDGAVLVGDTWGRYYTKTDLDVRGGIPPDFTGA